MLEFRILGPLEVADERGPMRLGGPKQRATLAILLLNANRVVPIDRLADDLYAGKPPVSAVKQVQRHISDLRKQPGLAEAIETRSPGYVAHIGHAQLDLLAFERLAGDAADADPRRAAELLRTALGLWRGPALADLRYESFAQPAIERLEELRVAAVEQRIDADLALGRHAELVGELEQLVAEHPLYERFRAQLMLALYRSGRQTDALGAYRAARDALVSEFAIEPTTALQELERRILRQDPGLALEPAAQPEGAVLAAATDEAALARLSALLEPLAEVERIVVRLVDDEAGLPAAAAAVNATSRALGARGAAFTTAEPAADVVRLAGGWGVRLVLVSPAADRELLERSPADVGIVTGPEVDWTGGDGVFVPFGGTQHDWAALELAAGLAAAADVPIRLVGTRASSGRRDASRLLANASIAVQRVAGVVADPVLADATEHALVEAVAPASLVVAGMRTPLAGSIRALVLVHAGPRPGMLAPRESRTRFSWSLAG